MTHNDIRRVLEGWLVVVSTGSAQEHDIVIWSVSDYTTFLDPRVGIQGYLLSRQ